MPTRSQALKTGKARAHLYEQVLIKGARAPQAADLDERCPRNPGAGGHVGTKQVLIKGAPVHPKQTAVLTVLKNARSKRRAHAHPYQANPDQRCPRTPGIRSSFILSE